MTLQLPAGPLSGPTRPRNRRRNPIWRFRRFFFVLGIIAIVGLGLAWTFVTRVTLEEDTFESLRETTYICTAEVTLGCDQNNAANKLVLENGNREVVEYEDLPQHLIDAVLATEDKSFFDHRGIDAVGITRAGYQSTLKALKLSDGALQGGSTITQQYVSDVQKSDCEKRGLNRDCLLVKAGQFVQAVKYEQEMTEEFGSKEAAKKEILERYFNLVYFGRGADGIQSASRLYFGKDVNDLTIAESAYIVGLLRSPNSADASLDLREAERRRTKTIGLMLEQEFITQQQADEALNDLWPNLVPKSTEEFGNLGEVKGSEYGTEYFIRAVRTQLDEIYPNREYYNQSYRVYTTLDPERQKLAYQTITGRLNPNVPDMPQGSLVSVDRQGRIVAMMGGTDWESSQVNLATGKEGGGSGFQPGSLMKVFALAEFLDQGFSPSSYFEAPYSTVFPSTDEEDRWLVRGGVSNKRNKPTHRTVYEATQFSTNTVYAQIAIKVGIQQMVDMANRMGVTADLPVFRSVVLGSGEVSVLDMAASYSTLEREGVQLDPVYIERIEDKDGNVVCWYPVGGTCQESADRLGTEALEAPLARQVNLALRQVVQRGTGKKAKLIYEDETWRAGAGKTGTTQNYRDAWFTGFTCGVTTAVWMGYPGEAGQSARYMSDDENARVEEEIDAALAEELGRELTESEMLQLPRMTEIFGEDYEDIAGGSIPAEMWRDYMLAATEGDPPCEELSIEEASPNLQVIGQELLTTLLSCETTTSGPPQTNENGETIPTQPTAPTTTILPNAEDAECLPFDEEGKVIELEDLTTTTLPNPAGPVSVDADGNMYDRNGNRVDQNGNRIDENGNLIDSQGRRTDSFGNLIDEFGNRIDLDGQPIDENGNLIDGNGNLIMGEDGNPVRGRQAVESTTTSAAPEPEPEQGGAVTPEGGEGREDNRGNRGNGNRGNGNNGNGPDTETDG